MTCPTCRNEGIDDDGHFCACDTGQAEFRRERDRHAWLIPHVRQAAALRSIGEDEAAEALKAWVLQ